MSGCVMQFVIAFTSIDWMKFCIGKSRLFSRGLSEGSSFFNYLTFVSNKAYFEELVYTNITCNPMYLYILCDQISGVPRGRRGGGTILGAAILSVFPSRRESSLTSVRSSCNFSEVRMLV